MLYTIVMCDEDEYSIQESQEKSNSNMNYAHRLQDLLNFLDAAMHNTISQSYYSSRISSAFWRGIEEYRY
jgi:hypothetical protein